MATLKNLPHAGMIAGPMISRTETSARLTFGMHYRDGLARVSASAPTWATAAELRAYSAWLLEVADAADAASLPERAS